MRLQFHKSKHSSFQGKSNRNRKVLSDSIQLLGIEKGMEILTIDNIEVHKYAENICCPIYDCLYTTRSVISDLRTVFF